MSFFPAHPDGVAVGMVVTRAIAATQAWEAGALLIQDTDGNFAECGADPAAVAAVALAPTGADVSPSVTAGFNILGQRAFPPGFMQAKPVQGLVPFLARYVGTLPAADGGLYGVVRDTDGLWKVDFSEIVAQVVKLVDRRTNSPENMALVEVTFIPDVVQSLA